MRIHHLNCGSLCPPGGRLFGGAGGPLSPAPMCCHCFLIEGDDRLILVDTGLGVEDVNEPGRLGHLFNFTMRPRLEVAETALRQVVDLGFRPSDVRHIVPTHLDLDHAGGISDFPGAAVHIYADELRAASSRSSFTERSRYRAVQISAVKKWAVVKEAGESWFGFSAVRAIPATTTRFCWSPCRAIPAAIAALRCGGRTIGSSIAATLISTVPRSSRAAARPRRACGRSKG
jgi:glyoxylase-like metal-dependent hydrolase (beta-lactamase superfamily II)